jgi:hypothetical protein
VRWFLATGAVVAALGPVAYSGAATLNPLRGIAAAARPQRAQDVLPSVLVRRFNAGPPGVFRGLIVPGSSRLLRLVPGGVRVYVARSTKGDLVEVDISVGHGSSVATEAPLNADHPVTIGETRDSPHTKPFFNGLALDGITSVSFVAEGVQRTVPVVHNVWYYRGQSRALASVTLHYADGHSQAINH